MFGGYPVAFQVHLSGRWPFYHLVCGNPLRALLLCATCILSVLGN